MALDCKSVLVALANWIKQITGLLENFEYYNIVLVGNSTHLFVKHINNIIKITSKDYRIAFEKFKIQVLPMSQEVASWIKGEQTVLLISININEDLENYKKFRQSTADVKTMLLISGLETATDVQAIPQTFNNIASYMEIDRKYVQPITNSYDIIDHQFFLMMLSKLFY
jgi:hypothetical protein